MNINTISTELRKFSAEQIQSLQTRQLKEKKDYTFLLEKAKQENTTRLHTVGRLLNEWRNLETHEEKINFVNTHAKFLSRQLNFSNGFETYSFLIETVITYFFNLNKLNFREKICIYFTYPTSLDVTDKKLMNLVHDYLVSSIRSNELELDDVTFTWIEISRAFLTSIVKTKTLHPVSLDLYQRVADWLTNIISNVSFTNTQEFLDIRMWLAENFDVSDLSTVTDQAIDNYFELIDFDLVVNSDQIVKIASNTLKLINERPTKNLHKHFKIFFKIFSYHYHCFNHALIPHDQIASNLIEMIEKNENEDDFDISNTVTSYLMLNNLLIITECDNLPVLNVYNKVIAFILIKIQNFETKLQGKNFFNKQEIEAQILDIKMNICAIFSTFTHRLDAINLLTTFVSNYTIINGKKPINPNEFKNSKEKILNFIKDNKSLMYNCDMNCYYLMQLVDRLVFIPNIITYPFKFESIALPPINFSERAKRLESKTHEERIEDNQSYDGFRLAFKDILDKKIRYDMDLYINFSSDIADLLLREEELCFKYLFFSVHYKIFSLEFILKLQQLYVNYLEERNKNSELILYFSPTLKYGKFHPYFSNLTFFDQVENSLDPYKISASGEHLATVQLENSQQLKTFTIHIFKFFKAFSSIEPLDIYAVFVKLHVKIMNNFRENFNKICKSSNVIEALTEFSYQLQQLPYPSYRIINDAQILNMFINYAMYHSEHLKSLPPQDLNFLVEGIKVIIDALLIHSNPTQKNELMKKLMILNKDSDNAFFSQAFLMISKEEEYQVTFLELYLFNKSNAENKILLNFIQKFFPTISQRKEDIQQKEKNQQKERNEKEIKRYENAITLLISKASEYLTPTFVQIQSKETQNEPNFLRIQQLKKELLNTCTSSLEDLSRSSLQECQTTYHQLDLEDDSLKLKPNLKILQQISNQVIKQVRKILTHMNEKLRLLNQEQVHLYHLHQKLKETKTQIDETSSEISKSIYIHIEQQNLRYQLLFNQFLNYCNDPQVKSLPSSELDAINIKTDEIKVDLSCYHQHIQNKTIKQIDVSSIQELELAQEREIQLNKQIKKLQKENEKTRRQLISQQKEVEAFQSLEPNESIQNDSFLAESVDLQQQIQMLIHKLIRLEIIPNKKANEIFDHFVQKTSNENAVDLLKALNFYCYPPIAGGSHYQFDYKIKETNHTLSGSHVTISIHNLTITMSPKAVKNLLSKIKVVLDHRLLNE